MAKLKPVLNDEGIIESTCSTKEIGFGRRRRCDNCRELKELHCDTSDGWWCGHHKSNKWRMLYVF